jgi:hypothetical protein
VGRASLSPQTRRQTFLRASSSSGIVFLGHLPDGMSSRPTIMENPGTSDALSAQFLHDHL